MYNSKIMSPKFGDLGSHYRIIIFEYTSTRDIDLMSFRSQLFYKTSFHSFIGNNDKETKQN